MERATADRTGREHRTATGAAQRVGTARETALAAVSDGLNAAPVVRQLRAAQAMLQPPAAAGGPPVQRVVRWNGVKYDRDNIGPLQRALRRVVTEEQAAQIVAHALAPGTYVYAGMTPQLIRAPQAPEQPVQAELPIEHAEQPVEVEQLAVGDGNVPDPLMPPPELEAHDEEVLAQDDHGLVDGDGMAGGDVVEPVEAVEPVGPIGPVEAEDPAILPRAPIDMTLAQDPARLGRTSWADYQRLYAERTATVNGLDDPHLQAGEFLFHATTRDTALLIKDSGLQPKQTQWGGASASKDGYLSMSTTREGANPMGARGPGVLLRVRLNAAEVGPRKWRKAGGTEVLTTQAFAPGRLQWSWLHLVGGQRHRQWRPMDEYVGGIPR